MAEEQPAGSSRPMAEEQPAAAVSSLGVRAAPDVVDPQRSAMIMAMQAKVSSTPMQVMIMEIEL